MDDELPLASLTVSRSECPLVSVIIPTYNRGEYLRRAVDSVLAQTYGNLELIVVDDGSTDETPRYLSSLSDSRVRVVTRGERSNAARARNAGLAVAEGEFVAFLDSDDLWLPTKLELQMRRLRERPEARWCYTLFSIIDGAGNDIPTLAGGPWLPLEGWLVEQIVRAEVLALVQTLVAEHSLVREIGGFDDDLVFGQDLDLRLRLAARSPAAAVPEVLCKIREHPGRSTYLDQEVHLWWSRVFAKFLREASPSGRLRRICKAECAFHLGYLADRHSAAGSHRRAFSTLLEAHRWWAADPRVWRFTAKIAARFLLPASLINRYRERSTESGRENQPGQQGPGPAAKESAARGSGAVGHRPGKSDGDDVETPQ